MHHQTTPVRRAARAAVGLTLLPALVVAGAAPAAAHDELIRTAPAVGETATTAPSEVSLTFSGELIDGEGIQNLLQVRDADGNQWQSAAGTVDGPTFSAPLCEGLPNGDYEVAYRVVYSDGHSEERSFDFAVDDPAAPAAGANTLVLNVREDSWIEVRPQGGKALISRLVKAGSTETFEVPGSATLVVGNPKGVSATLRGAAVELPQLPGKTIARVTIK